MQKSFTLTTFRVSLSTSFAGDSNVPRVLLQTPRARKDFSYVLLDVRNKIYSYKAVITVWKICGLEPAGFFTQPHLISLLTPTHMVFDHSGSTGSKRNSHPPFSTSGNMGFIHLYAFLNSLQDNQITTKDQMNLQ